MDKILVCGTSAPGSIPGESTAKRPAKAGRLHAPKFPRCDKLVRMRRMGIDYGSKKVGVAFTDEGGSMAFPHGVLPNDGKLLPELERLIHEKRVEEIVIGHSLDRDGKPNAIHAAAEGLMTDLTLAVGLPIYLEPEQYTTQQAARVTGKNQQLDSASAALILEGFLTKHT